MNIIEPLIDVYKLSFLTLFLGLILDNTIALETLQKMVKKDLGLYYEGVIANIVNLLIISPLYYLLAYHLLIKISNEFSIFKYFGILIIQGIFYYY